MKIKWVTQEWGSNLSYEVWIWMKLGGERLRAQESVSKCLQYELSVQLSQRGMGAFYSPLRESNCWGVRNPDMSGQPLCKSAWGPDMSGPGLSRWGIKLDRTCPDWGPDMSRKYLWNPAWESDMSDPELSRWGIELDQTCPGWGPDMSGQSH
jgi:hypothetical protein